MNNHTDVFLINREFGRTWEERVSQWLQMNEQYVLDVYEYAPSKDGVTKAPKMKIFPEGKSLILPDLQVASAGATHWIEIKSKACCYSHQHTTWERSTGFDLYLWNHYNKVQEVTGLEVYVFFVHVDECEIRSASLDELKALPSRFPRGDTGIIFWDYDALRPFAIITDNNEITAL